MTIWTVKEQKAKIYRILELGTEGFNIPRFFSMPRDTPDNKFDQFMTWVDKILNENPEQIFNIRTYNFDRREGESLHTEHITDLSYPNLMSATLQANMVYHTMIDAETPDNGRVAGNIIIKQTGHRDFSFTIDFCSKKVRAMVRDADTKQSGRIIIPLEERRKPEISFVTAYEDSVMHILKEVVARAFGFSKKDVVLEWTWFSEPAGIKGENLVWWEYRKARK